MTTVVDGAKDIYDEVIDGVKDVRSTTGDSLSDVRLETRKVIERGTKKLTNRIEKLVQIDEPNGKKKAAK
jgi:hypothetical protein